MKIARFVLIGATILIGNAALAGAALAQQDRTGMVTMIDRIDRNVAIRHTQNGTVGSSTSATEVFKVPQNVSLDNVHVGDEVAYAATDTGGGKSVTKLEKK